jgi:hypothetical protein
MLAFAAFDLGLDIGSRKKPAPDRIADGMEPAGIREPDDGCRREMQQLGNCSRCESGFVDRVGGGCLVTRAHSKFPSFGSR